MPKAGPSTFNQGKPATIAGHSAGKPVYCSSQALPVYRELEKLAKAQNYWAVMAIKGIKRLAAGRLNLDNIYVQKGNNMAYGKGMFFVVLPGVTATLEDRADGTYMVRGLIADTNYLQQQESKKKPGLWRVPKDTDIRPTFQEDGRIRNKEYRPVVIGDRAINDPHLVAKAARKDLIKTESTIKTMVNNSGFDLHHTPGDAGGIVGLKKSKTALATSNGKDLVESATLLANTMYRARDLTGVLWFSDWGGSAVLTRAFQILQGQNIKLSEHKVFLNRPTSSSSDALKLARSLDMEPLGNGKRTGLRPTEISGNHLHTDITLRSLGKAGAYGLTAAGAAFGFIAVGAGLTVPAAVGIGGGMLTVHKAVKSGVPKLKGKEYK